MLIWCHCPPSPFHKSKICNSIRLFSSINHIFLGSARSLQLPETRSHSVSCRPDYEPGNGGWIPPADCKIRLVRDFGKGGLINSTSCSSQAGSPGAAEQLRGYIMNEKTPGWNLSFAVTSSVSYFSKPQSQGFSIPGLIRNVGDNKNYIGPALQT